MSRNKSADPEPGQKNTQPGAERTNETPSGKGRRRADKDSSGSKVEMTQSERLLQALSQAAQGVQRARTPDAVYRAIGDEVAQLGLPPSCSR